MLVFERLWRRALLFCCICTLTLGMPAQVNHGQTGNTQYSQQSAGAQVAVPVHRKQTATDPGFHHAASVNGFQTPSSGGYQDYAASEGNQNFGGGIIYEGLPAPGQHSSSPSTYHGTPNAHNFGYEVSDAHLGNKHGHTGFSDGKTTKGEYRVLLPDGRTQVVTYSADKKNGFQARVTYEGTAKPYNPPAKSQHDGGNAQYSPSTIYNQG